MGKGVTHEQLMAELDELGRGIDDLKAENEALRAERDELRAEVERMRSYALQVGSVLLDEAGFAGLELSEACTRVVKHMVDDGRDSFIANTITAFVGEASEEGGHPVLYDLIVQRCDGQPFQENLEACKADNDELCAKLSEYEDKVFWTGCGSGDCPHEDTQQCADALVKALAAEIATSEELRAKLEAAESERDRLREHAAKFIHEESQGETQPKPGEEPR